MCYIISLLVYLFYLCTDAGEIDYYFKRDVFIPPKKPQVTPP